MTKKEFLDNLAKSLAGNLPAAEIEENIRYYKDYIENGEESEAKALETLGDPHLIAKTIIDSFKISKGPMADFYTEQARDEYKKGVFDDDTGSTDYRQYEKRHLRPNKLLTVLILVAVIALILVLGGLAAVVIVRVVLPVLLVVIILNFITNRFNRS